MKRTWLLSVCAWSGLAACAAQPSIGQALREPPPHGWAIAVETNEPFTDGLEVLTIGDGGGPVTLDRVEVLGSEHLQVVGFHLARPEREIGAVQFFDRFPPDLVTEDHALESLASIQPIDAGPGLVVPDHPEGAELLLGAGRHRAWSPRALGDPGGLHPRRPASAPRLPGRTRGVCPVGGRSTRRL